MDNQGVESAISNLRYTRGTTYTGDVIQWTLDNQWPKARPKVHHAMVILTDGKPSDSVSGPSAMARAQGIKMFTIGVGGSYNTNSLKQMASQPYSDYVYGLKDFDLKKISQKLIDIACNRTNVEAPEKDVELRPTEVITAASDLAERELDEPT